MTAAAADDLIPRHRATAPTQPSAAAAHPGAANGAVYGAPADVHGPVYGPAPQQYPGPQPASAPAGYAPVSASTAGALAARYQSDADAGKVEPLGAGWTTVTIVIGVMAALIALGGMVLSFRAVSVEMVPAFGQRWAWLVPIVVDLTVFVFSGVDLVLARLDMGHPLARWTVYGATGGTVWLNYSAGGTAAGRVAHVLMPSIWVVFVELMRHVVRRQVNLSTASHREPIPAARWFLSPWPTLKLWRRMVLWRINSYPRALDQEKMRLGAIATAREMYGRFWRFRISPLTRLQINLGEVGAGDLRPGLSVQPPQPAQPAPAAYPEVAYIPVPAPTQAPAPAEAVAQPTAAAHAPAPQPQAAPAAQSAPARTAPPQAPQGPPQAPAAAPPAQPAQPTIPRQGGAHSHREPAAFASQPLPSAAAPMPPSTGSAGQLQGRAAGPALAAALAATQPVSPAPAPARANGAGAAHAAPSALAAPSVPAVPQQPADGVDPVDTLRLDARQDPPHVEFQAPPPMPPLPRRSVRESELLTAAREVERWRGQPSATRISRELGIGMPLATSLANALREEEGPGE